MPSNVWFVADTYGYAGEVSIFPEANLSLWDDNSSWKKRTFGAGNAGAQDELVF
jgi:hypothetical protein